MERKIILIVIAATLKFDWTELNVITSRTDDKSEEHSANTSNSAAIPEHVNSLNK